MTNEQRAVRNLFRKLVGSPAHLFPKRRGKLRASNRQGVYVIYDPKGVVVHVGRTLKGSKGLAQRLRNHMLGASSFTIQYLDGHGAKLRGKYRYRLIAIKSKR